MGLMTINTNLVTGPIDLDMGKLLYVVVSITTDTEVIRISYYPTDSKKKLLALLESNGISKEIQLAVANIGGWDDVTNDPGTLATKLPGTKLQAKHPVRGYESSVFDIIVSLNDTEKWTREKIAEWLENTFDTKDIAFTAPEGVKSEAGELSEFTKVVKIQRLLPC